MPIDKVVITNYQSHEETILKFSNRMNVLFGDSDQGKSAAVRSIRWAVINRPNGERFRRHFTDETSVLIKTYKSQVTRTRSDSKNNYTIKGKKDPYKALRMEIPEDVSTALNLDEINIQSQDDVWFLVDQTPGQVSKKLNKVAGLEITDKVIKQVNSDVKEANADKNKVSADLLEAQRGILDFDWVKKAEKFLSKLEDLQASITKKESKHEIITEILVTLELFNEKKNKFISEKAIEFLDKIIGFKDKLDAEEERYSKITDLVQSIEDQEKALSDIAVIDISELEKLSISIESEQDRYDSIDDCLAGLKLAKLELKEVSDKVKKTDKDYHAELKRLGKCPTCNAKT